jgi:hypothetical protein
VRHVVVCSTDSLVSRMVSNVVAPPLDHLHAFGMPHMRLEPTVVVLSIGIVELQVLGSSFVASMRFARSAPWCSIELALSSKSKMLGYTTHVVAHGSTA